MPTAVKTGAPLKKGGLRDKIEFVRRMYSGRNKTRLDAVQGLCKRYPDMRENYAKTIVYTKCSEMDFVSIRKRVAAPVKPAKPVKKTPVPAKGKPTPKPKKKGRGDFSDNLD